MGSVQALRQVVLSAYRVALQRMLPPKPQVARHWQTPDRLHWLALLPTTDGFHLAYSLGTLKATAEVAGQRHTSGLFRLSSAVFPEVDEPQLLEAVHTLVPAAADGPTRAFLQRIIAQLAVAEVAATFELERATLPLGVSDDFCCHVPGTSEALFEPAPTPRLPVTAGDRVLAALDRVDPPLRGAILALFDAPEATLLEAVRHRGAGRA